MMSPRPSVQPGTPGGASIGSLPSAIVRATSNPPHRDASFFISWKTSGSGPGSQRTSAERQPHTAMAKIRFEDTVETADSSAVEPMQKPVAISYGVFALILVLVALLHLGTPFLAALFCFLALNKLAFWGKKWIALTLFVIVIVAVFSGFVFFLKRAIVVFPEIVETAIPVVIRFAEQHGIELPFTDIDSLRAVALDFVRDALGNLGRYVKVATKEFIFLLAGVVIAVGVFLNPSFEARRIKGHAKANLYTFYTSRIRERVASFYHSFETVMGAQILISAINASLTAIFVFAIGLRYASLVIILTFLCGLLPIVGNFDLAIRSSSGSRLPPPRCRRAGPLSF